MSAISDKLAKSLSQFPFINVVEHEQHDSAVNVLCRVKPGCGGEWAAIAERILRESERRKDTPDYWHTHIARVYMLRNNRLVYGWTFVIASTNPAKSVSIVGSILQQLSREPSSDTTQIVMNNEEEDDNDDEDDGEDGLTEDDDYTDSESPLPPGAVPDSDEKGNPIVPRSARVRKIQMAGLPKNYDRNAPTKKNKRRGSWSIEGRKGKSFRPPVRN